MKSAVKTLAICLLVFLTSVGLSQAQSISYGAMNLDFWIGYSYTENDDGTITGGCDFGVNNACEYNWRWYGSDNGNLDGQGNRGGTNVYENTNAIGWVDGTDVRLFQQQYGSAGTTASNVPQYLRVYVEAWEDDCFSCAGGTVCVSSCSSQGVNGYDGSCPCSCDCNGEDKTCFNNLNSPSTDINYRSIAPCGTIASLGTGYVGQYYTTTCGGDDVGGEVLVRYTPPIPTGVSSNNGTVFCGSDFVNLSATGAVFGGSYVWYNNSTGAQYGTGTPISIFLSGNTTIRVHTTNGSCESQSYRLITISVSDISANSVSAQVPTCSDGSDGSLTINASGSNTPLQYSIDNGASFQSSSTFSNLPAGSYNIVVKDAGGCEDSYGTYVLNAPSGTNISQVATVGSDCFSNPTGSITVTASGGATPLQYSINNGATYQSSNTFSNLTGGQYNILVKDANGCVKTYASNPVLVSSVNALNITNIQSSAVSCAGDNDGSMTIFAFGGTGTYQYSIDGVNFQSSNTFNNLAPGSYNITLRDAVSGCDLLYSGNPVVITEPTALSVSSMQVTNELCFGQNNGAITVNVAGGTPTYNFSWSGGGQVSASIGSLSPGIYTVTVTDAKGCTTTATDTVNAANEIAIDSISFEDLPCNLGGNGEINIYANGGSGTLQYSINGGGSFSTSSSFSNLAASSYNILIKDANNCVKVYGSNPVILDQPAALNINLASKSNVSCNGAGDGFVDVSITGGTAPFNYNWSNGDTSEDVTDLVPGSYTLSITDNNGCTKTATYSITQPTAIVATLTGTPASCNGATDGTVDLSVSGGSAPYTYLWSNFDTTQDLTGVGAGIKTVVVEDDNNCSVIKSFTVTEPSAITFNETVSAVSCNGAADGSITTAVNGGTPGYSYNWSTGDTGSMVSGLAAGVVTLTVTDNIGCTNNEVFQISEPAAINTLTLITDSDCHDEPNGQIALTVSGGSQPYSYLWSTGDTTQDLNNALAGDYTVTVTDANGCSKVKMDSVSQPDSIFVFAFITDANCAGLNGAITLGFTPALTYLWSTGATTTAISGLTPGYYQLTATDLTGCDNTFNYQVTGNDDLFASLEATDPSCGPSASGAISVTPSGGTAPYSYSWTTGDTVQNLTGLSAGTYGVTITDNNGCVVSFSETLEQDTLLVSSVTTQPLCPGGTGSVDVTVSGGNAPYTYFWSNLATTQDISNVAAGFYTLIIQDGSGCTEVLTAQITNPAAISLSAVVTDESGIGTNDGAIDLTASNGTMPYSYSWSTGDTTADISGLAPATYSVTVTDVNGCTASGSWTVDAGMAPCNEVDTAYVTNLKSNSVKLNWGNPDPNAYRYEVQGRKLGQGSWKTINRAPGDPEFEVVAGLLPSTRYEWRVRKICDTAGTLVTAWLLDTFKTICVSPDTLATIQITSNSARLIWGLAPNSQGYEVWGRQLGGSGWAKFTRDSTSDNKFVGGLAPATSYEWKIRSFCTVDGSIKSQFIYLDTFTTMSGSMRSLNNPLFGDVEGMSLGVYPNPNEGQFRIFLENAGESNVDILIYNKLGTKVIEKVVEAPGDVYKSDLDLSDLEKGIYFIKAISGSREVIQKVIIQ